MFHWRLFVSTRLIDRQSPDIRALKYLPYHAREGGEPQIWFETMTDFAYLEAVVARVDVGQGEDADGTPIPWHEGYFVVADEIQKWLLDPPGMPEVKNPIQLLQRVWEAYPDFVRSPESVIPSLYRDLISMEPTEPRKTLDRAKRRFVLQGGPIWTWCERERSKYESPGRPWASSPKYVAFISYRREGGADTARAIREGLLRRGIHTFLDVDDLGSNYFDERLLREIENAPHFILILSTDSLDRCVSEEDWLGREIAHAIKTRRNIIPILKDGFRFPPREVLPPKIADLPRYNGVDYSHRYFEATVDEIVSFFHGEKQ